MKELTGSAKTADDAIAGAERFLEHNSQRRTGDSMDKQQMLDQLTVVAQQLEHADGVRPIGINRETIIAFGSLIVAIDHLREVVQALVTDADHLQDVVQGLVEKEAQP